MSRKQRNSAIKEKWKSSQHCRQRQRMGRSSPSQLHSLEHHCVKVLTAPRVSEGNSDKRDTEGICFAEGNLQFIWAFAAMPLRAFPPYFFAFCSQGFQSFKDPLALGVAQILTLPLKRAGCEGATWGLVPDETWAGLELI